MVPDSTAPGMAPAWCGPALPGTVSSLPARCTGQGSATQHREASVDFLGRLGLAHLTDRVAMDDYRIMAAIVEIGRSVRFEQLPGEVPGLVVRSVLDSVACGVAGSTSESAMITAHWAAGAGGDDASIMGTSLRASAPAAALANGTATHALHYDDMAVGMIHPSTVLVPALLSIGEARHASGAEVLDAYLAGYEVLGRISRVLAPAHFELGWHATSTIGRLGAAVAVSRLMGLGADEMTMALGIAASTAGGLRISFGSMVKPLHAGQAAFHGVQAGQLAEAGLQAHDTVIDGPLGFVHMFGPGRAGDLFEAMSSSEPTEMLEWGIAIKNHACCGAIHAAIDGLLDLKAKHRFGASDIESVEVQLSSAAGEILTWHTPRSTVEAKLSLEYSMAVALLDGRAGLAQYSEERFGDPEVRALEPRIRLVISPSIPVTGYVFPAITSVVLKDGQTHTVRVDVAKGYPGNPLSDAEHEAKILECCSPALEPEETIDLIEEVRNLDGCPDVTRVGRAMSSSRVRRAQPIRSGSRPSAAV